MDKIVRGEKINIRLTDEIKRWLFKESDRTGKTVSQIIREAVIDKMNSE